LYCCRLSSMKLPSPTDHVERVSVSTLEQPAFSLPSEPAVASHTFLVLPGPSPSPSSSLTHTDLQPAATTTTVSGPGPLKAFLYSEEESRGVAMQMSERDFVFCLTFVHSDSDFWHRKYFCVFQ
jgi:hypothetical protein